MIKETLAIETTLADLIEEAADALYDLNVQFRILSNISGFDDKAAEIARVCATMIEGQARTLDRCAVTFQKVTV
mgnify:FL=1